MMINEVPHHFADVSDQQNDVRPRVLLNIKEKVGQHGGYLPLRDWPDEANTPR
jgi:hypothetical protein